MDLIFFASWKQLKKHGCNFLQAQKSSKTMNLIFCKLKKLKKYEFGGFFYVVREALEKQALGKNKFSSRKVEIFDFKWWKGVQWYLFSLQNQYCDHFWIYLGFSMWTSKFHSRALEKHPLFYIFLTFFKKIPEKL